MVNIRRVPVDDSRVTLDLQRLKYFPLVSKWLDPTRRSSRTNGWTITVATFGQSSGGFDVTDAIEVEVADYAIGATVDLLADNVADNTIVEITVTPKDSGDTLLTASATTFTKTVTA